MSFDPTKFIDAIKTIFLDPRLNFSLLFVSSVFYFLPGKTLLFIAIPPVPTPLSEVHFWSLYVFLLSLSLSSFHCLSWMKDSTIWLNSRISSIRREEAETELLEERLKLAISQLNAYTKWQIKQLCTSAPQFVLAHKTDGTVRTLMALGMLFHDSDIEYQTIFQVNPFLYEVARKHPSIFNGCSRPMDVKAPFFENASR